MTTPTTAPEHPVFDTLVARAKTLFWGYSGPEIWDDPDDDLKVAYDLFYAGDQAWKELEPDQIWQLFVEQPTTWFAAEDLVLKRMAEQHEIPAIVLRAMAGQLSPVGPMTRSIFRTMLIKAQTFAGEVKERLGDTLSADEKVKAESERRWALTGQPVG